MPANITNKDGQDLFVYNVKNGHPWHQLGISVEGNLTVVEALEKSGSDDHVVPVTMTAVTPDGIIESHDSMGVWSNKFGLITGKASPTYTIMQRREIVELAYEIVGLSKGDAQIDTMGNLGERGERFFTYIKVPNLVIDPNGIADEYERGLAAGTSFDLSLPNFIHYTEIRAVCENTVYWGMKQSQQTISVKHTKNAEERIVQAAKALGYIGAREKEIIKRAERLLAVPGDEAITKLLNKLWPIDDKDMPAKTKTRRANERGAVRYLYEGKGNKNAALVGENGYAALQAVYEYFDHLRPVRGAKGNEEFARAQAAVLPGTKVDEKQMLANLVLN